MWLLLKVRLVSGILGPVSDPAESLQFSFRLKDHIRQEKTGLEPLQHSYADSNYASQQQVRGKGAKDENKCQKYHFDFEILLRNMMHTEAGPHEEVGVFY